jgi:hypothetical protein
MRKIMLAALAAAAAIPATAQVNTGSGNGLVAVNIQNVDILKNFLNNDQISALNNLSLPITVQVPIGVAANVCNISAAVLANQRGTGAAPCDAKTGSRALAQNVITQKLNQKRGH